MQDLIFHSKPRVYGTVYFLMIPVFGLAFYFLPATIGEKATLIKCLYFSAVTITTLGYGDIAPTNDLGRVLASLEAVMGVTIIGLFITSLSRTRAEAYRNEEINKERRVYLESEIAKLNGHYNLILPLAEKYKQSVIQITSPVESRTEHYNPDFSLNDMRDLYRSSMLMTQDYHQPAVNYYFSSLKILNTEISDLIKSVDLRLFPEIERDCLSFVDTVHSFDFSDAILGAIDTKVGDRKMTTYVSEMLEKHEGEVNFKESNIINGYVALYQQIKLLMRLLNSIDSGIKGIIND